MSKPREPLTRSEAFQVVMLVVMGVLFITAVGWLLVDKDTAWVLMVTAMVLSAVARVAGHASRWGHSRRVDTSGLTGGQGED
ncbi:MAG: hypothetical protein PV363_14670 [Mumia sp.]|nr:hypothetical protein [Mumia sp.]